MSVVVAPCPPPPSAQAVPVSASATSWPWITTLQAKGFSDHSPWASPSCLVSRGLQPLAQSAQAVSQPAYRLQGTGGGKPRFLPPFSSVLFPGSLSSWQQLVQWPCCRYWKIFASPVCSSLSSSLWFPFLPRSPVVSLVQGSVRPLGVKSYGSPAATTIARVVSLVLSCHIVPVASQPLSFSDSIPKCVIPGLFGYMCSVITKL